MKKIAFFLYQFSIKGHTVTSPMSQPWLVIRKPRRTPLHDPKVTVAWLQSSLRYNEHSMQFTHLKCAVAFSVFKALCSHHHNQFYNIFITLESICVLLAFTVYQSALPTLPSPREPLVYSLLRIVVLMYFFLMTNDVEQSFHMLIMHLYIFFEKLFIQFLCPFKIGLSFPCWIVRVLYIS